MCAIRDGAAKPSVRVVPLPCFRSDHLEAAGASSLVPPQVSSQEQPSQLLKRRPPALQPLFDLPPVKNPEGDLSTGGLEILAFIQALFKAINRIGGGSSLAGRPAPIAAPSTSACLSASAAKSVNM